MTAAATSVDAKIDLRRQHGTDVGARVVAYSFVGVVDSAAAADQVIISVAYQTPARSNVFFRLLTS